MYKSLTALLAVQMLASAAHQDALADPAAKVLVSPDGALPAIIIDNGYGIEKSEWTPDSRYFVYDMESTGGHQPYYAPTFFYSRQSNRVRD